MAQLSKSDFTNFFKYYAGEPHQIEATGELFDALPAELKDDESAWVKTYREKHEPAAKPIGNPLDVP